MNQSENILGTEKIGKLIKKFSIPCILSMLVNSLYNIVDQIFIGQKVGMFGNGATNIIFPIVITCLALALMFGDGSSAFMSLKLGEKRKEEAGKGVANGIVMATIISVIISIICIVFLPHIIKLFGCTQNIEPYALEYGYIIVKGIPFMIIGIVLNSIIRADGSPRYAMFSMVLGAVLNIILDYILLYTYNMGVKGAAIATVVSQIVTLIINVIYIRKLKSIKLNKNLLKPQLRICKEVVALGISSFITEMSFVVLLAVENNILSKYGSESEFGADIPITVLGIVIKISQILNSIVIGIAVGSQPIIGYNYGSRNFDRVKKALKYVLFTSLIVSTIAFALFQLIPEKLIAMFGSEGPEYVKFACMAFRIYLMLYIVTGIQIPSGIFFQAIGKSIKSVILSLSRQIGFLIPAMIILGKLYGINGVLYAGPVADALALIIASALLIAEIKSLKNESAEKGALLVDDTSTDNKLSQKMVITISREYGSGGRYVARLVADKLGIRFYDKDFVAELSAKTGLSESYIESNEQKRKTLDTLNNGYYVSLSNADELFVKESDLIREIASKESCVIVGRCADYILKDNEDVINVFIYSNMEDKIKRAVNTYGISDKDAEKEIRNTDKQRSNHYKHYTGMKWGDPQNYDLCLNSDSFGVEKTADIICDTILGLQKNSKN
ncbi:MAG: MATE family efflux transporter [Clostridia bacterium]|nr:MATE family efflux transporter [Clostridia bacterium]